MYFNLAQEAYTTGLSSVGSAFALAFLPLESLFYGINGFIVGACLTYIILTLSRKISFSLIKFSLSLVMVFGYVGITFLNAYPIIQAKSIMNSISVMSQSELKVAIDKYSYSNIKYKPFIFNAIVQNRLISQESLHKIALMNDSFLLERMSSKWLQDETNLRGFPVKRMIAKNTKASPETLDILGQIPDNYIKMSVALNQNATVETLEKIYYSCSSCGYELAMNPNISKELLDKVIQNKLTEQYVSPYRLEEILNKPNLPEDVRDQIWDKLRKRQALNSANLPDLKP